MSFLRVQRTALVEGARKGQISGFCEQGRQQEHNYRRRSKIIEDLFSYQFPIDQSIEERKMRKEEDFPPKPQIATQEEMVKERVPLPYRDQCAHLLIPLNKCRQKTLYLPWKCSDERHAYEKCEYELVMARMIKMDKLRKQAKLENKTPAQLLAEQQHATA